MVQDGSDIIVRIEAESETRLHQYFFCLINSIDLLPDYSNIQRC